jgi:hypothetical protein
MQTVMINNVSIGVTNIYILYLKMLFLCHQPSGVSGAPCAFNAHCRLDVKYIAVQAVPFVALSSVEKYRRVAHNDGFDAMSRS